MIRTQSEWNGAGWSLPLIAFLVPLLDLVWAATRWCVNESRWMPSIIEDPYSVRSWLLQLSAWSWIIAWFQVVAQLCIAQARAEFDYGFWVALLVVAGLNVVFWMLTVYVWNAHLYELGCASSPAWAPVQVLCGIGSLFALGAGLYAGGALLILDGLVRLYELLPESKKPDRPENELALGRVEMLNDP
jgi:hypothetical protein